MTRDQIMDLFDRQMKIVELSLHVSFGKYAARRDETIAYFSEETGIPASEFEDRLTKKMIKELV